MKYSVQVKLNKDFIEVKDGLPAGQAGKIVVGVKARPEKGKANEELLKKLARHFKVPVLSIRILRGKTSRNKIIKIDML